ncbi:TolC family protein [Gabonibacter chumensis]|uniref:TolC family protein n=1 Tax=Gabonibacter chumensis TaxID=2972474 RepID=UPI0025737C7E|nr:TolC family protein [Gabonibacter chumensis]MCR9011068.1 TolC family protein [Gabonibacter chumensis]
MRRVIFSFVCMFLFMNLCAQREMSLEDFRRLAIENNKNLKIADEEIRASREQKKEAFTKYLPGIDAMGTYMRNQKEINLLAEDAHLPVGTIENGKFTFRPDQLMSGPDGKPVVVNGQYVPKDYALLPKSAMTVDERNLAVLQIGLTQPLYMGGKIRAYNQLAGLSEKLAESNRSQELQNIIVATDEAYWQIVSLVNRKQMAEKYVETLKKFEHDVLLMEETGVATKADVLSVKVKLNQGEMMLTKVEDGLSLSRMVLNQICGLPIDTVIPLRGEHMDMKLKEVPGVDIRQVFNRRPEVASLTLATDMYKKKEKIALSEYLPTIALMANWFASTPSFYDGISAKFDGMWSVGIGIKAPIFHWGASRKSLRHAKAQTNIMNYKLQEAKEKIELQVNQSEFKVKEVAKKLEMARKNMEKAEENLRFAHLGFQEGTIPVLNVLEAQTAWLSANAELIDTRIEAKLSEVYLQKAYGTLLEIDK